MKYTLIVEMRPAPGALIRALGLVERRRFALASVSTASHAQDGRMQLTMQVEAGERSPHTLVRQLQKQFDIESVSCWPDPAPARETTHEHAPMPVPAGRLSPLPATVPA